MLRIHRPLLALLAVVAALVFTVATVDARVSGSSGSRVFSAAAMIRILPAPACGNAAGSVLKLTLMFAARRSCIKGAPPR